MNKYLILRVTLSLILIYSFLLELFTLISYNIGYTIIDIVYFTFNIVNILIVWIRKPFFWFLGLFVFSTGIYYCIQFEYFYSSSNIPAIMSTKPMYYYFIKIGLKKWFCNIIYYLSYFLYSIFLILFLFNCRIKKYYKIYPLR